MRRVVFCFLFGVTLFSSHTLSSQEQREKKRLLFIVNPLSSALQGVNFQEVVAQNLDRDQFDYTIVTTQYPQHATQIAQEGMKGSFDMIAAVGGDGTVNEVGKALIHSSVALAIIPIGSGNGLAKHLGIPTGVVPAIQSLNSGHSLCIDTAKLNDHLFLGTAGVGFDAHVARQFATFGKRGLSAYCQVALREYATYWPQTYHLTLDGQSFTKKAFILTFANSSQYGNDFMIAPQADLTDGALDLVIIDTLPPHAILNFLYQCKQGTLHHSRYFESYRFKELIIQGPHIQAHIDGEPMARQDHIKVQILPKSLRVFVPN